MLGIFVLLALGTWQLDRLFQKEHLITERQAALKLPPVDLTSHTDVANLPVPRRVTVAGRFQHTRELRVGPRSRRGRIGWQVITPLKLAGGRTVLVDRGWVPESKKDPGSRQETAVAGAVALAGFVQKSRKPGWFTPDNDPPKGNWYWVDPVAMATYLDMEDRFPFWIVAARQEINRGLPIGIDHLAMPANNHLQYAITWFGLAFALAGVAFAYWRRSAAPD